MPTGNEKYVTDKINSMSINEARHAIASNQFGSIGRPDRAFAAEILAAKEASERDSRESESLSIFRKALQASEDANRIALQALSKAKAANIWAAIATLIAAIAMYIAYVEYIKIP